MAFVAAVDRRAPADLDGEDPAQRRNYRPPYMCQQCDVGQSVPTCWLCAQPCEPTPSADPRYDAGSLQARILPACYINAEPAGAVGVRKSLAEYSDQPIPYAA